MTAPVALVPPPTADAKNKQDAIEILKRMLEKAEAGELRQILVIAEKVDGFWMFDNTGQVEFCKSIGQLEIIKQDWIDGFRREQ